MKIVAFADEAAGESGGIGVDEAEIGLNAAKIDGGDFTGFRADGVSDVPVAGDKRGHVFDGGAAFLNGVRVFDCEGLALAFLEGRRTTVAALIPLGDECGVGTELFYIFLDLGVETGDKSGDEHDDADAEDDAKDGEGTAEFVGAKGIHGLPEIFAVGLRHKRA